MQLKTSFFHKTVFRKNLTRFAPAWGLYTLCLLLGLLMMYADGGAEFWLAPSMGQCIRVMALVNCGYALLNAQLLFGDLYNSRMCNALHAIPLRRECWFATNLVSGLAFSLGPTLVMALASLPLLAATGVARAWQIGLYWFLAVNLEYVCFFGIAVFSAFCVGSRFAMALVYSILNGASMLAYFLVDTIYTPMLFGVQTQVEPFFAFCPLGKMIELDFLTVDAYTDAVRQAQQAGGEIAAQFHLTENWWYLWACAAVGAALMAVSLLLYRWRKLECAGDFMAGRAMEPVFQVLYTLMAAGIFQLIHDMFFGAGDGYLVFLPVGMVAGWFTGRMLLERSVRVFRGRNFLGLLALSAAVAVSLGATALDVFGIETRVPQAEQVESASVYYYEYYRNNLVLTDREDIENVIKIHELALEDRLNGSQTRTVQTKSAAETGNSVTVPIWIQYRLRSGETLTRQYFIWADEEEGQLYKMYLSSADYVLGESRDFDPASVYEISLEEKQLPQASCTKEAVEALREAIEADCAEGTMAQFTAFHDGYFRQYTQSACLYLCVYSNDGQSNFGFGIDVWPDSRNTLAWLEEQGALTAYTIQTN